MKHRKERQFIASIAAAAIIFAAGAAFPAKLFPGSQEMTLAALGDCILSKKVSVKKEPAFLKLVELIRSADCAWANCELPLLDIDNAYPEYRKMDIPGAAPPWVADELKWLGVDCVGLANNHTMDYGYEGLFSTIENLERVGIGYAGAGSDLEEAARPRYVDTSSGRVGQVSCASWFHHGTFASLPNPYVKGRPGLNPMRGKEILQLKEESFETLKQVIDEAYKHFGLESKQEKKQEIEDELGLLTMKVVPGKEIAFDRTLDQADLKRISDAVKVARRNARIVIVANHEHIGRDKQTAPGKFLETFARACIDAGADVVFNTGPHRLWGIEIYKGKPIFYSLGNFFFQVSTDQFPAETYTMLDLAHDTRDGSILTEKVHKGYFTEKCYWQGVLPIITFENGSRVSGIKLYPVTLNQDRPLYEQGLPTLASKEEGKAIIESLAKMSAPYKTSIAYRGGVGIIKPNSPPTYQ